MGTKFNSILLSVALVLSIVFGSALNVSALQMGGSIQGAPINVEPAVVSTLAGSAGASGSTDGTGSAARFYYPEGMTTDRSNLFVMDSWNHTIRKIVISTGVVTTIAGTAGSSGSSDGTGIFARFSTPHGITTDGTNLFVADTSNHTIRKIVIPTGVVTTIAGTAGSSGSTDGTGSSARFYGPQAITTDGTNLFVADNANHTIRKIIISTGVVTTIAGTAGSSGSTDGTGSSARFYMPYGITTDGTSLFVADQGNHTIRKIVISTGVVTTIAGTAGSPGSTDGTGSSARFDYSSGITTDGTNLFVADTINHTIRKIVISTGVVTTIAGTAGSSGSSDATGTAARFYNPNGITTDGTSLFVADTYNHTIRRIEGGTSTCTYTISPASQSFGSSGGSESITVMASASSCAWTATSSISWVTITSGSNGTGSGVVSYSVSSNTSTSSRTGNITIAGQTFTITQSGTTCTYTISPASQSFGSSGGSESITVMASASSCAWTATSSISWVTITSGSNGTGSGVVSYSVSSNTSTSSRTGNITIAGQTFAIMQSGDTQTNCAATISSSLVVHIPILTYSGYNFWVELTYDTATSALLLTNLGLINDMTPYTSCAASTLSSDFNLYIPVLMLGDNSYYGYLQYKGSGFVITAAGQNPPSVSGRVVKGPLSGATVNFFTLNSDGSKGALIGNANTDSQGNFSVNLTVTPQLPILAEASGGSYINEISGGTETLSSTDILTAVVPAGTAVVAVTPLTHMAAARARVLAAAGSQLTTAVNASNAGVAQQYQLLDIIGTLPVAINDSAQMATASRQQREYGLVLAAITKVAADLNVRPIDLAQAFATDMEDGTLDGLGLGQTPIPIPTLSGSAVSGPAIYMPPGTAIVAVAVIFMPPGTPIATVNESINRLLSSDINLTNMTGKSISLVPVNVNPMNVPFFITSTALPAWTEGQNGTATITASAPCTWTIPAGSALPDWLRLNAPAGQSLAATLTGTPPLLPGGSTQRNSAPFVVRCQNAVGAIYAVQWTATIVKAPPVLVPIPAACVAGTRGVALPVATANGGVPPYYFMSPSFMYGAPPLGMSVWTDGTLRGTCPTNPGPYNFPVLVVDSIGAHEDPLANVTLTVNPACTYSISPASQSFGSSGGSGSVTVTASDSNCSWTVTNYLSWVTITAVSGNGTVTYSVAANTGTSQRSGTITIAGQTFTVTQDGATPSCTYSISTASKSFGSSGGSGSVTVTAASGCAWTAASNSSWITITSGSNGSGNGTVAYSVAANTGTSQRSGTITIAGQSFTVTQDGATPSCTYSISPISQSFWSSDVSGSVTVTAASGCAWTAASNSSWITITSGSNGSGNGTVTYSVAANTGTSQRSGTITIAGQSFTVTQAGASSPSSPFKGSVTGSWQGTCPSYGGVRGGFSMTIDANGKVTGSYSGSDSGSINGTVNTSGNFYAAGSAGGAAWNGSFSVSGTTLSGSGTWSESGFGCSGTWSGTGSASQ